MRGRTVGAVLRWLIPLSGMLVTVASFDVLAREVSPEFAAQTMPVRTDFWPAVGGWLDDHTHGVQDTIRDWSGELSDPLSF